MGWIDIEKRDWDHVAGHIPIPWPESIALADAVAHKRSKLKLTRKLAQARWGLAQKKTRAILAKSNQFLTNFRPISNQFLTTNKRAKLDDSENPNQFLTNFRPISDQFLTTNEKPEQDMPVPHTGDVHMCGIEQKQIVTTFQTSKKTAGAPKEPQINTEELRLFEFDKSAENGESGGAGLAGGASALLVSTLPPEEVKRNKEADQRDDSHQVKHAESPEREKLPGDIVYAWGCLAGAWGKSKARSKTTNITQLKKIGRARVADGLHRLRTAISPRSASRGIVKPTKSLAVCALEQWARLGHQEWDSYISDALLIIDAARNCPAPLFANDIRSEGRIDSRAEDRKGKPSTLFRGDRWARRLEVALDWRAGDIVSMPSRIVVTAQGTTSTLTPDDVFRLWVEQSIQSDGTPYSSVQAVHAIVGKAAHLAGGASFRRAWQGEYLTKSKREEMVHKFLICASKIIGDTK